MTRELAEGEGPEGPEGRRGTTFFRNTAGESFRYLSPPFLPFDYASLRSTGARASPFSLSFLFLSIADEPTVAFSWHLAPNFSRQSVKIGRLRCIGSRARSALLLHVAKLIVSKGGVCLKVRVRQEFSRV